ncbi:ABC transporter transmembrane domain-containing protein, partial [Actinomadura sp. CNU-125]|uniref:ABC transporter transmembrane domain-containing protein n=1 Tax=Actinomadura sp. CNU-125 TaxID=1904961 RepID=UPI000AAC60B5
MKAVERRLLGRLPRRVPVVLGVLAAGQGVLLVVQAELLARAGSLSAGPLPWPGGGGAGARVTLLTRGLDAVDPFFVGYVPQLLAACVVPVLVLGRLAAADWASALVVAVTVPLVPLFGALVGMRAAALTERQWGALRRLGGHFRDVVA